MNFLLEFWEKVKTIEIPVDQLVQPFIDAWESPSRAILLSISFACILWIIIRRVIDFRRGRHGIETGDSNKIIIAIFIVCISLSLGWDVITTLSDKIAETVRTGGVEQFENA